MNIIILLFLDKNNIIENRSIIIIKRIFKKEES